MHQAEGLRTIKDIQNALFFKENQLSQVTILP
jgi:hypothetical protein